MSWTVVYSRQAAKDSLRLSKAGLRPKAEALLAILAINPFKTPPPCERLVGDLEGLYSRRLSLQHRLVYEVFKDRKTVRVLRLWTHYGK